MITVREAMRTGLSDVASNDGHVLLKVSGCPGITCPRVVTLSSYGSLSAGREKEQIMSKENYF